MGFEGQADLQDAEAQQDDTYGPDEGENKFGQIIDHGERIVRSERGGGEAEAKDDYSENGEYAIGPVIGHMVLFQDSFPPSVEL